MEKKTKGIPDTLPVLPVHDSVLFPNMIMPIIVRDEKEVVYYADKRVNHAVIVSLDERLTYLLQRYGKNEFEIQQRIRKNFQVCEDVEKKIFNKLRFKPEEINIMIS